MGLAYGSSSLGDRGYPKGCFVYTGDGKAYFNPHRDGGGDPQRRPLCVCSLNAPGAAASYGALPRRCTCTCSLASASRLPWRGCVRYWKRRAKGRVIPGTIRALIRACACAGPTDNLAHMTARRLPAHMTDTIAPPVQCRRPMIIFGPFSLPSPLSAARILPSVRPRRSSRLVAACAPSRAHIAPSCAHMLAHPLVCKQNVSRDFVSHCCWSLPLLRPCV